MMNDDQKCDMNREQFEAWHRSVVAGEPPHEKYSNGDYRNQHVQRYWLGWQASREAVTVALPLRRGESTRGNGFNDALAECTAAIKAQGLKVAE